MRIVFVVHLAPSRDDDEFLSEEVLSETKAQIMTAAEASAAGLQGVPDDPNVRLVVAAKRERGFLRGALERAYDVVGFTMHEVGG